MSETLTICRACGQQVPAYYLGSDGNCAECRLGGAPARRAIPDPGPRGQRTRAAASPQAAAHPLPDLSAAQVSRLPKAQARAYSGVHSGMSEREIAARAGIRASSVATALKRLRKKFAPRGGASACTTRMIHASATIAVNAAHGTR